MADRIYQSCCQDLETVGLKGRPNVTLDSGRRPREDFFQIAYPETMGTFRLCVKLGQNAGGGEHQDG